MKLTRYGKASRSVSAVSKFQPSVKQIDTDRYVVTGVTDISGEGSCERGTEVRVHFTEPELRKWLHEIDTQRARDNKQRELIGERAVHALELIHALLLEMSYESMLTTGSLSVNDRRVIKLAKKLAGAPNLRSIRQAERHIARQ